MKKKELIELLKETPDGEVLMWVNGFYLPVDGIYVDKETQSTLIKARNILADGKEKK